MDRSAGVLRWYLLSDKAVPLGDMLHIPGVIDWHRIADLMWHKMTLPEACKELGYDEREVMKEANLDRRTFLLDTSMLAGVRDEYLGERE